MGFKKEKQSLAVLLLIIAIIAVVAAYIVMFLRNDIISNNMDKDHVMKILFVVEDENHSALFTDAFLYYSVSNKGALFEIPGNTGAIYASLGRVDRIDEIYKEKGIVAYESEIEKLINAEFQYYLKIDIQHFAYLTDLLGGLEVFVPSPVDIQDDEGNRWLLPSGAVLLDGDKITTYLTYQVEGELEQDRRERHQNAMVSLLKAMGRNNAYLSNKKLYSRYASNFETNADPETFQQVLSEISRIDTEKLVPQSVTGSLRKVDGKSLLFPYYDGDLIKEAVQKSTTQLTSLEEGVNSRIYVLEIQNGTLVQGLAHNASILLQGVGYDVLSAINADSSDYEKTVIINHIGNSAVAKTLGDFIHCTNIVEETVKPESAGYDVDNMVDFTIILGKDFDGRYVRSR
ncbi:MAG: LCP family protein [Treponema sp.]|nr:LCP family protein [Treponema sp.]